MSTDNAYLTLIFNEPIFLVNETMPIDFNANQVQETYSYLGENAKGILLLIENEYLSEDMLSFVINILKAVNLTLKEVAILENYQKGIQKTLPKFNKIIQFGGEIVLPGFECSSRYIISSNSKKNSLLVDKVSEIMNDVQKKRLLWEAIKVLF